MTSFIFSIFFFLCFFCLYDDFYSFSSFSLDFFYSDFCFFQFIFKYALFDWRCEDKSHKSQSLGISFPCISKLLNDVCYFITSLRRSWFLPSDSSTIGSS